MQCHVGLYLDNIVSLIVDIIVLGISTLSIALHLLFVKLLLDVGGNILLDIVLLEGLRGAVHGVLGAGWSQGFHQNHLQHQLQHQNQHHYH